jgi:hypothetical protein
MCYNRIMPILQIVSYDENSFSISTASPGSGIDIPFIPNPDIGEGDNEVTYTFEDDLIVKTTRIENEYELSIKKTIGGTTFTYKEMMDEDDKLRLSSLIGGVDIDEGEEDDQAVGAPVTSIEQNENILRLTTSPGYGYTITFVPGTAVLGGEEADRVWTLPGVNNKIEIINSAGENFLPEVKITVNGIVSVIFMEDGLKDVLVGILNAPAAVGGRRRRHRKTRRRQPKKKRRHTRR